MVLGVRLVVLFLISLLLLIKPIKLLNILSGIGMLSNIIMGGLNSNYEY